jgi:hypothetical protein
MISKYSLFFFFIDKIYDEEAALQQAEDEAKRIRAIEKRNHQVRQLFHKQTKANRTKVYLSKFKNSINLILLE